MNIKELAEKINAVILTGQAENEVTGIYACDLLSRVMAKATKGNAWITVHTHLNVVAVAVFAELSCVVIPEGIEVEEATLKRAINEGIPILTTQLPAYEICGRYYAVRG